MACPGEDKKNSCHWLNKNITIDARGVMLAAIVCPDNNTPAKEEG